MLRHEIVMQGLRCFFPKGKHQPLATSPSNLQSRRVLKVMIRRFRHFNPEKSMLLNSEQELRESVTCESVTLPLGTAVPSEPAAARPLPQTSNRTSRDTPTVVLVITMQ